MMVLFILAHTAFPQGSKKKDDGALTKSERDEIKKVERSRTAQMVDRLISDTTWVLEADYLAGRSGVTMPVSSTINFIAVNKKEAIFQLGTTLGGPGLNGVGGTTVEGTVTKYLLRKKVTKKGNSYFLTMYLMTAYGTFDVFINSFENGTSDATLGDNRGNKLRYYGRMVEPQTSRIYKGMPVR
jgi:hypothetical protein